MEKTLIGKDGYLFLINDSSSELEVHCNNLCLVSPDLTRFDRYKDKYCITIFPNKSYVQKQFLPEEYKPRYRPGLDCYKSYFGSRLLDGLDIVNDPDIFYKTDTHINLNGVCRIYTKWIEHVHALFGLTIPMKEIVLQQTTVNSLAELDLGIGDLTWEINLGKQILEEKSDVYWSSDSFDLLYLRYILQETSAIRLLDYAFNDCTLQYIGTRLDWVMLSKHILYHENKDGIQKKVVFFYDSF